MDDRHLAQASIYLRNAAPEQWNEFVRAFEAVTNEAAGVLLGAKVETIMSDQGWAKAAAYFLRTFKDPEVRVAGPRKPTADR